jgi:hypothetical protein
MAVTIAAIAGSLRAGSHSRALLRAAARDLPPGVRLTIWDGLERVPPFSEDLEAGPAPAGAAGLRRLIAGAAAVLIATPEYDGVHPGPAENCPRPGIPPSRRRRPGRQAGRGNQRQPQPARRRLGPGGPAQGAHRYRRRPDRNGAGGAPGSHPVHPRRLPRRPGPARPHHPAHQQPGRARHRRQPCAGGLAARELPMSPSSAFNTARSVPPRAVRYRIPRAHPALGAMAAPDARRAGRRDHTG